MSIAAVLVYVVTILVAGIVALTYLKPHLLQPQEHPDQLPPKIHLYAGAAGLVVWILFLVSPSSFFLGGDVPGVIGLFGIWLAAIAGTYLLVRRLKEQRAAGHVSEDAYGYDDGYGDEYAAEDGYGYDEAGYGEAGYDEAGYAEPGYADAGYAEAGYNEYGELDERAAYVDPQQAARRPEPRRAASSVEETAVMAPIEREPSPAPSPAPAPAPAPARGSSRSGQTGRRVAGRQAPEPPAPEAPIPAPPAPAPPRQQRPAPERTRQERPAPERPRQERPAPERPRQERPAPEPPAPERSAPRQPDPGAPGAPGRSQDGQDPWGRRQEPPQRRPRGYDGRYDDRRNDSHDEFADRRYRRDSSYPDYSGQPQPAPRRAPRPAPQPAPQPAPAPAPPPPPQAPRQQPDRRAAEQQPEAYDPYSLESYGPRGERSRDQAPIQQPAQDPAQAPAQPGRRQPDQGYYAEQAYAGYEQGYDDAYAQGYGYDQAYDGGYDDRYDDAYDHSAGGRRSADPERGGTFFETSGAAILVHITLVILAIWLTWAYGTSVI